MGQHPPRHKDEKTKEGAESPSTAWWARIVSSWYTQASDKSRSEGVEVGRGEMWQAKSELAAVLSQQKHAVKADEAVTLARQVLSERESMLGPMHQETLESAWLLGSVLEKKGGKEKDASSLYERAYKGAREVLGDGHPDTKDYLGDVERLKKGGEVVSASTSHVQALQDLLY
ncbi:hypothetical protein N0V83_001777 [Neocucurbitaria cava]|uniref:Uncharacterized protein n=1 Tax=Neocucurbitaria cava TaxID=798079 RepID=A0A9W9CRK6_9PLEO|nr:hypothetical protein N0V83_001777 [Neocucurbitaria cava]